MRVILTVSEPDIPGRKPVRYEITVEDGRAWIRREGEPRVDADESRCYVAGVEPMLAGVVLEVSAE